MEVAVPKVGDIVAWRWGSGVAEGRVTNLKYERAEIISKGKPIVRNGSANNPAVVIIHTSGTLVLKLASELQITS